MAIETITEGNKYDVTTLEHTIIDYIVKDSKILEHLQFEDLPGNSLTYDKVATDSTASFYSPGDTWTESTPVLEQGTVTTKIMGGDIDIDKYLAKTRTKINMEASAIQNKTKAMQNKFLDTFFYGSVSSDAKSFDGLHTLLTSTTYNTVHAGSSTGTALSINKLRECIDLLKTTPDYMVMSKQMRRYLSVYLDSVGSAFPRGVDRFGAPCETFENIPIIVDDHILNTETAASGAYSASTGGGNTTIFIIKFAPQAVCGVQNGGIEVEPLGTLETKDATRIRVKWYCGLKLENIAWVGKVDGVDADGTVTA